MKISIIGASAGVGLETLKRGLQRNHNVTTLSRSEIAYPTDKNWTQIKGNALNKDELKKAIEDTDAIIVALGTGKNTKPTTLFSDFARVLLVLHKEMKIEVPVIILTGFGAGESIKYAGLAGRLFMKLILRHVYSDKTLMEESITTSDLNWVIVRPGILTDGPLTEKYKVENRLFKGMNVSAISRADVADYMVKQAENPTDLLKYTAMNIK
jgi:putative NADH-flavin reductase